MSKDGECYVRFISCHLLVLCCFCISMFIYLDLFFLLLFFLISPPFYMKDFSSLKGLKLCNLKFVSDFMAFSGKIQDFPQFVACSEEE